MVDSVSDKNAAGDGNSLNNNSDDYRQRTQRSISSSRNETQAAGAMEVVVDHGIDKAMKVLKRKLIKEGLFKELKSRRYYEKPSERKKRKEKESKKKLRKEEARQKKNALLFG